jgi:hypothetical protein
MPLKYPRSVERTLSHLISSPTTRRELLELYATESDCPGFDHLPSHTYIHAHHHKCIAAVVTRISDSDQPYEPGVELAHRITMLPELIRALQAIVNAESIYEAQTAARDALALTIRS